MEKYMTLQAAGFLSPQVIEPADMTTQMLSSLLREMSREGQRSAESSPIAQRAFSLIRQEELVTELSNRAAGSDHSGHYTLTTAGFGVSPDMFDAAELHHTEWQKSVDRFISERDLIISSGIKAQARLVFLEIRLAEFRTAIRQLAMAD